MIPVNTPLLEGNEKKYLNECIDTGWISSEGPFVNKFEQAFSKKVNRKYGVALSSGTAALDVAVTALGIGKGDEVILPAFTIISCVNQIIRVGAIPVLVDSDPVTWNMDVSSIESKVTKRTKAIMVVHTYGLPVDMAPVLDVARRHGLMIIEDAAEAHGQTYNGIPCGSFGDVSTFSFYPNKHVTTGEGGMIVTDNEEIAEHCRQLRNLCFQPENRFVHEELGWNLRLTNLQAAIGLAQLERLDEFVERKQEMGAVYTSYLLNINGVTLPVPEVEYAKNNYWVYGIVLEKEHALDAKAAMKLLQNEGIGTRPFFCPMHLQPVLRSLDLFDTESYPESEHMYEKGFYIPSGLGLSISDLHAVSEAVRSVLA